VVWVECVCVSCVYSMGCVCALCAQPLCVHEAWGSEPCQSVEPCGVTLGGGSFWVKPGGAAECCGSVPGQVGTAVRVRAHGGSCLLHGYTCGNVAGACDRET